MQTRKRKTKDPCLGCYLHKNLCICDLTPRMTLRTRVVLLVHHRELKRTTNTGRLAHRALINSEMLVRGRPGEPLNLSHLTTTDYRNLIYFPSAEAVELSPQFVAADSRPIRLIVPDGNWRQASKVPYRHSELRDLAHVKISEPNQATNHLRAEHMPEGMATLEAIARALGIIEGDEVESQLTVFYRAKLERTLLARGQFE